MAEVICVGVAFLDCVFEADLPASNDSKTFARNDQQFGGGMAATASISVARRGGKAALWGRVGNDEVGERIRDGLAPRSPDRQPETDQRCTVTRVLGCDRRQGRAQFTDTSDIETGLQKMREATEAVVGVTAGAGGF